MEKTKIEWTDSTWNPVTGCYHDCPYCYARGTANRFKGCDNAPDGVSSSTIVELSQRKTVTSKDGVTRNASYPFGFIPTLHKYRLDDPVKKGFGKTVFVCSMADLFGDWVPDEWIEAIFESCKKAENHRYLFLTKNPKRYFELHSKGKLPKGDSYWYGTTMTNPENKAFCLEGYNTFISIEPLLAPFGVSGNELLDNIKWVIIGAESGNRKDKVVPEKRWIEDIVTTCDKFGIKVFMKDSLKPIVNEELRTEFPWDNS